MFGSTMQFKGLSIVFDTWDDDQVSPATSNVPSNVPWNVPSNVPWDDDQVSPAILPTHLFTIGGSWPFRCSLNGVCCFVIAAYPGCVPQQGENPTISAMYNPDGMKVVMAYIVMAYDLCHVQSR